MLYPNILKLIGSENLLFVTYFEKIIGVKGSINDDKEFLISYFVNNTAFPIPG